MQLRGISQGHAGQVGCIDLDDGKIGERICADELGRQDSTVRHGDANIDCAIDDVVVGDDVAIGRNDDAAAETVLNVRLRAHLLPKAVLAEAELATELFSKELLQAVGIIVAIVVAIVFSVAALIRSHAGLLGNDGYVDDGGSDACGQGFHGTIKRKQRADAVIVESRGGSGWCRRPDGHCQIHRL